MLLDSFLPDKVSDGYHVYITGTFLGLHFDPHILLSVPFVFGILLFHSEIITLLATAEIGGFIGIYTSIAAIVMILYQIFS